MANKAHREQILKDAWIGDAVLCLYVRGKILREDGITDGPKAQRMTSNQFLSALGEPSEVEAELGRVFDRKGLDAAFEWIESRLLPVFARQEGEANAENAHVRDFYDQSGGLRLPYAARGDAASAQIQLFIFGA